MFSCLKYGCCHPSFCLSWCCPLILMGQVMTRLKLNIWALPGTPTEVKNTFKYMLCLWVGFYIFQSIFAPPLSTVDTDDNTVIGFSPSPLYSLAGFLMFAYSLTIMIRTRRAVREKYAIPDDTTCGVSNDCCCSFWCSCCTVSLLARQTADYENDRAMCCTETGLRREAPVMVV